MTKLLRLALGLLAVLICGCAAHAPQPHRSYSPLILISIDGYRADYFERGLSPRLAALAADGVRAQALKPAFPTLTFPNHYTIVTGLFPDHHGIVNNRMFDPASGKHFLHSDRQLAADPLWWGGEPLWVGVQRQGKRAATMFWPGSDVQIDGVRPQYWKAYDKTVDPAARVDQVLSWLDLPATQRPDLITLYFEQVDHAGHDHGPDSPEVDAALREIDAALGKLINGLDARRIAGDTNLVVVSDHGMSSTSENRIIILDDVVAAGAAEIVNSGVLAGLTPKAGHEREVESAVLVPHDHMRCWRKSGVPAHLHYGANPRIPALLCLADDGWLIDTRGSLGDPHHHTSPGEHGYDNDDPAMRALFVAHGPAFRRGLVVPEFDNVDVYPLLTRILHITPAPNDGDFDAVAPMLTPEYRPGQPRRH